MKINRLNNKFSITFYVDILLLIVVVLILLYSILVTWSASNQNYFIFKNKIFQVVLGLIIMIILAQIRPRTYERYSIFLYILFILLLIIVHTHGQKINGAKRWINFFGILNFQPSEISKLVIPLILATFTNRNLLPLSFFNTFIAFIIILFPVILIGMQPDLGTALLISISGFFILLITGIKKKIY